MAIESYDLFMQLLVGMAGGCTLLPLSLSREQSKGFGCFAWPMAATTTASTSSVSLCGYVLKRALLLSWISCGCLLRNLNLSKHIGWRIVPCVSKHVYTQTSASVANWQAVSYQTLQPGRAIFHRRVSRTRINFGHLDRWLLMKLPKMQFSSRYRLLEMYGLWHGKLAVLCCSTLKGGSSHLTDSLFRYALGGKARNILLCKYKK
jgi:hypothetical protein